MNEGAGSPHATNTLCSDTTLSSSAASPAITEAEAEAEEDESEAARRGRIRGSRRCFLSIT